MEIEVSEQPTDGQGAPMRGVFWGFFGFFLFMSLMTYASYMNGGPINLVFLSILGVCVCYWGAMRR